MAGEPYPPDEESTAAARFPFDDLPAMSARMHDRITATLDDRPDTRFECAAGRIR